MASRFSFSPVFPQWYSKHASKQTTNQAGENHCLRRLPAMKGPMLMHFSSSIGWVHKWVKILHSCLTKLSLYTLLQNAKTLLPSCSWMHHTARIKESFSLANKLCMQHASYCFRAVHYLHSQVVRGFDWVKMRTGDRRPFVEISPLRLASGASHWDKDEPPRSRRMNWIMTTKDSSSRGLMCAL